MSDIRFLALERWGFNKDKIISEHGKLKYKNLRKRERVFMKGKPWDERITVKSQRYLVQIFDKLMDNGMRPSFVDRPLLVDIIQYLFPCSKQTALSYARTLIYIDMRYPRQ